MYEPGFLVKKAREDASFSDLLTHCNHELWRVRARQITQEENSVAFRVGMFRPVGNWNLLVGITHGEIRVDPEVGSVRYRLSFQRLVIWGTAMACVMGGLLAVTEAPPCMFLAFLPLIWGGVVGGNYLFALARFDRLMKKCMRESGFSIERKK